MTHPRRKGVVPISPPVHGGSNLKDEVGTVHVRDVQRFWLEEQRALRHVDSENLGGEKCATSGMWQHESRKGTFTIGEKSCLESLEGWDTRMAKVRITKYGKLAKRDILPKVTRLYRKSWRNRDFLPPCLFSNPSSRNAQVVAGKGATNDS